MAELRMKMQPWMRLRYQLYRQVEMHVQQILGPETQGLHRYRRTYERAFERSWKASHRDELMRQVGDSQVIFLGDFHALQQSQRAQLRILKAVHKEMPLVLAVEFFEAQHQALIDLFLGGQIGEREFLKQIQWQKNWGFPWEHYRPLVRWAQKRRVRIVGLNKRESTRSSSSLARRDRFAAKVLAESVTKFPSHQHFVIFGDLHLAHDHLPKHFLAMKPKVKTLTVFQNSERLYFKVLTRGQDLELDVVRLNNNQFCLLNVPPWVKWQNYLIFLQQHLDRDLEDGSDLTDEVERYLEILCHDLGFEYKSGEVHLITPSEGQFWSRLTSCHQPVELKTVGSLIERDTSFFLPHMNLAYLSRPSVNHAASLAMMILHMKQCQMMRLPLDPKKDFQRWIWIEAIRYFGSKLINPKRKTDTLQDLKVTLASQLPDDLGKESLQLALSQKMTEVLWLSGVRNTSPSVRAKRISSYLEAARLLGGMLGEKLYLGIRKKMIPESLARKLIQSPVDNPLFSNFYLEVVEMIEGVPEPFLSKTEKL